jgi:hypothetical protein
MIQGASSLMYRGVSGGGGGGSSGFVFDFAMIGDIDR